MIRRYSRWFYTLTCGPRCYRIYEHKRNRGGGLSWLYQVQLLFLLLLGVSVVYLILYILYTVNIQEYSITSSALLPTSLEFLALRMKVLSSKEAVLNSHVPLSVNIRKYLIRKRNKNEFRTDSLRSYLLEASSSNNLAADPTLEVTPKIVSQVDHNNVSYKLCRQFGKNLQLFVAVMSVPSHARARLAIRQTWGHFAARRDIAIGFIVGSTTNAVYNRRLKQEEYMYQDIIRGKFLDSYDDSTAKTISMLKWVNTYCFKATFILKVSDDIFVNIPRLLTFISTLNSEQRAVYGRLATKWKRRRYEKLIDYKPTVFPDFIIGPTYLFPTGLSKDLYYAAIEHAYVKYDDVFLTGIVANDLQIERINVPQFFNRHLVLTLCNIERVISVRVINESGQFDLWTKLFTDHSKC